jgi:hypothetical protein
MKKEIKFPSTIGWTFEEKRGFVNRIETLPDGMNKYVYLKNIGFDKRTYDRWRNRYGVTVIYSPVVENITRVDPTVLRFVNDGHKYYRKVEISVSIKTTEDIINLTNELKKVKNVLDVISVE